MKVLFKPPTDGKMHRFCLTCGMEGVGKTVEEGITKYPCPHCGQLADRTLYFDRLKYWLDDSKELWHESVGVFVRNKQGKYLFFKRTEYPVRLTIPSGHVDIGESAQNAAARELQEEVGIKGALEHLRMEDVKGDSCSAGADIHRWSAYLLHYDGPNEIAILDEGEKSLWLNLEEAQEQGAAFVVDYMINRCRTALEA